MSSSGKGTKRYPDAAFRRLALAPGILGAIALLAGLALLTLDTFIIVKYVVAILGCIVGYFVVQAKQWWWLPVLAAIVVLWNPVFPFSFRGTWWLVAQYVAAIAFIAVGILVKVRNPDDRNAQQRSARR